MNYLRRYGFAALVVFVLIFPFVFYSSSLSNRKDLSLPERIVYVVTYPVQSAFYFLTHSISNKFRGYIALRHAHEEAEQIKKINIELKVKLQIATELERENARLRDLLHFVSHVDSPYVSGEVISGDPSYFYKGVRLNRGKNDGIFPGLAVVAAEGAVGVVTRTLQKFSDVLLITDRNSNLDVIVVRNRRRGIVEGMLGKNLRFKYLDKGGRIQVGDTLITSGLTGPFPRGIHVGQVSKVELESDIQNQTIEVEPSVNISQLSEAVVLLRPSREISIIQKTSGEEDWLKLDSNSNARAGH